jgi:hypothetical protein
MFSFMIHRCSAGDRSPDYRVVREVVVGSQDAVSRGKISASAWNRTENDIKEEMK